MRTLEAETLEGLLGKAGPLRYVGTAADEISGGEVLRKGIVNHFKEFPARTYSKEAGEAFERNGPGCTFGAG